jgi:hypothetical protein
MRTKNFETEFQNILPKLKFGEDWLVWAVRQHELPQVRGFARKTWSLVFGRHPNDRVPSWDTKYWQDVRFLRGWSYGQCGQ